MIQRFNQGRHRAIGIIRLKLTIGDLESTTLFHVINCKSSYHLLLGRPWLYETEVVPSTLHQCFKYYQDGVQKRVVDESQSFTKSEAYFVDAKFYLEDKVIPEALPVFVPVSNKTYKGKEV